MKKPKAKAKGRAVKAPKKKRVTRRRVVEQPGLYKLSITMNGETYCADAETLTEALMTFSPGKIVGKILFAVDKGEKHFERLIFPQQARRIFGNRIAAEYFVKGISMVIDN